MASAPASGGDRVGSERRHALQAADLPAFFRRAADGVMALTRMAATPRYRLTDAGRREALAAFPETGCSLTTLSGAEGICRRRLIAVLRRGMVFGFRVGLVGPKPEGCLLAYLLDALRQMFRVSRCFGSWGMYHSEG